MKGNVFMRFTRAKVVSVGEENIWLEFSNRDGIFSVSLGRDEAAKLAEEMVRELGGVQNVA